MNDSIDFFQVRKKPTLEKNALETKWERCGFCTPLNFDSSSVNTSFAPARSLASTMLIEAKPLTSSYKPKNPAKNSTRDSHDVMLRQNDVAALGI